MILSLLTAILSGNVTIPARLMTYKELATALCVEGKTVACDQSIAGRAAVVRLTAKTWDEATSVFSKGLGIKFEQDKKIETHFRMIPDPAVTAKENRLFNSYTSQADKDIQEAIKEMRRYRGSKQTLSQVDTDAIMESAAGPAKPGQDRRAWARVLQSDLTDAQKGALFQLQDMARSGFPNAEPLIAYFESGGKLANLITGGKTYRGLFSEWRNNTALNGSLRNHVDALVRKAEHEIRPTPFVEDQQWNQAKDVHQLRAALDQTVFLEDLSFDPIGGYITLYYKSFNPSLIDLILGGSSLCFSDLTSLNTFRVERAFEAAGENKDWEDSLKTTREFRVSKDAVKPFEFKKVPDGVSGLVCEWAILADRDVVMEYDLVEEPKAEGAPIPNPNPGSKFSLTLSGGLYWLTARKVDLKKYAARGLPRPGDWIAEESDGTIFLRSTKRFLNRKYAIDLTSIVRVKNQLKDSNGQKGLPLSSAFEFGKNAKAIEAGSLSRFSVNLGIGEPGLTFPFLRWLSGMSAGNLSKLKAQLKESKEATFPVSSGLANGLADNIRTVTLLVGRRDSDYIFGGLSSHPGFDSFVSSGSVKVIVSGDGSTSFGLGAPGEKTFKAWFGNVYLDWDN